MNEVSNNFKWQSIEAPAKINLSFDVVGRLPDGFHEIKSLVTPISIHDTLSAALSPQLTLKVQIPQEQKFQRLFAGKRIPEDESNLVLKAAKTLQRAMKERTTSTPQPEKLSGATIILTKRIPAEAGLGGGSSDAAAVLILLNDLWQAGFSRDELMKFGAQLGSDVPLFLKDFPVICRGRGEILERIPDGKTFPTLHFVVVKPSQGCSTPEVYRRCQPTGNQDEHFLKQMILSWKENRLTDLARGMKNALLAPAMELSSDVKLLMSSFREMPDPCLGYSMTGSGSACFGLCRNQAHAIKAANFFEHHYSGTVFVVETKLSPLAVPGSIRSGSGTGGNLSENHRSTHQTDGRVR